eukprot:8412668-Heterocapsa_arctica.AAC.1
MQQKIDNCQEGKLQKIDGCQQLKLKNCLYQDQHGVRDHRLQEDVQKTYEDFVKEKPPSPSRLRARRS